MGMTRWILIGVALGLVTACDAVRYPGDGGDKPETPDAQENGDAQTPPGAPGPPPPSEPVDEADGEDAPGTLPGDGATDGDAPTSSPDGQDTGAQPGDPSGDGATTDENDGAGGEAPDTAEPDPGDTSPSGGSDDSDSTGGDDAANGPGDAAPPAQPEPAFSYYGPGNLLPGSGSGAPGQVVHAPDIVFPVRTAPSYLQSMVWNFGGGVKGGDQCDPRNYDYPWRDNFCETRTSARNTPFCPADRIHQGQDIRVGTPEECLILRNTPPEERVLHEVVAVEDGVVYDIATYTVKLRAGGRIYRYMHLNMDALQVSEGDTVRAGDVLGYVSNDFGGSATTFHLHFEIIQNTADHGWVHVPPYLSLVAAYERREQAPGEQKRAPVATAGTVPEIPEGLEIIE